MGSACRSELNIRVDHAEGSIAFCDDPFVSAEDSTSVPVAVRENAVQPSTAELVRTRLSKLAQSLHNSLNSIYPPSSSHLSEEEQQAKFSSRPPLMPNVKLSNSEGPWSLVGANFCPSYRFAKRKRKRADVQRQVVVRKTRKLVGRGKMFGEGSWRRPARRSRLFDLRRLYLLRKLSQTKANFMFPLMLVLSFSIISCRC